MSYFSGQHGQLYIKPANSGSLTEVGRLQNWSVNFQQNVLDTTCLQDVDKTILNGVRSFTGQATMLYYKENNSNVKLMTNQFIQTGNSSYSSKTFGSSAAEPSPVFITLRLFDGSSSDISFYAIVNSFSLSCSVGEVVTAELGFEGTGAPTSFGL